MKLHMWGTRGSLPRALTHQDFIQLVDNYAKKAEKAGISSVSEFRSALRDGDLGHPLVLGGNTSCTEVIHKNHRFFVDMGTGFAEASGEVMSQGRTEFTVFMTHLHWDHIMGLPFFVPIYRTGNRLIIYHVHPHAPEYIRILFNGINFPVKWDELGANVEFRKLRPYEVVNFDNVSVSPFALDHPGGSFGYRFDVDGTSLAVGVDSEYKRLTPHALGADLPYYQNLDLLVFDGQYELDELASRHDWGHCSPSIGVDLALREGIRNVIITHHDPRAGEAKEAHMLEQAQGHCHKNIHLYRDIWNHLGQESGPNILLAYDGMEFDLNKLIPRGQFSGSTGKT